MCQDKDCWKCHWCWLGRCMESAHYGQDVSVIENQPKDCKAYISKEDWNRSQVSPMSQERCMELINAIINNLSVAERNNQVIKYLLYVGFTKDELINHFNFAESDVLDAEEGMDEYSDSLIFV